MSGSTLALVAAQLRISIRCIERVSAFRRWIDDAAARAGDASSDASFRLFVFPEDIGHFLPLAFSPAAANASTVEQAIGAAVRSNPLSILRGMVNARSVRPRRAALHAFLPRADKLMREVFTGVARRHNATVVAGSHLRARGDGGICNSSYLFAPDGRMLAVTDKVNLVPGLEDGAPGGLGLSRGDPDRVPVVDAGWGKVATLVCYDGFCAPDSAHERFANVGKRVDLAGADVIANPAASPWSWAERAQPWRDRGLASTLNELSHVRYGVIAHLCGGVLDQEFEGRSEILRRDGTEVQVLARADTHSETEIVSARIPLPFD